MMHLLNLKEKCRIKKIPDYEGTIFSLYISNLLVIDTYDGYAK